MTISTLFPPYPDLPNGYTITESEWNGQFNSIINYLNGTVKPAVDTLQAAPAPNVGAQHFFDARLTLETGVPISSTDQSAKTTLYLTPFRGNLVGLYDGTSWSNVAFTADVSLTVPSIKRQLFDVFVFVNSGSLVLEAGLYKNITATNSPSAGNAVVITCADTSPFLVGMVISVSDGSNAEECVVTAISTNTSITVDWLAASYTTPNLASQTPVTALTLQDGVLVKSGATTRRYVGTVMTNASGQTEDTMSARLVANYYHRVPRPMRALPTSATWNYSTLLAAGWTPQGGIKTLGLERLLFVNAGYTEWQATHTRMGGGNAYGVGFDQTTGVTGGVAASLFAAGSGDVMVANAHGHTVTRGRHFLQTMFQYVDASVVTNTAIYNAGGAGQTNLQVGHMTAQILN